VYIRESFGQRLYAGYRVRLSCSNRLIYTGHHTFRRHATHPRAAADGVDSTLVRSPIEDFSQKISGKILLAGPLRDDSFSFFVVMPPHN